MSHERKVERQRERNEIVEARRKYKAYVHKTKLDERRPPFVGVPHGRPDLGDAANSHKVDDSKDSGSRLRKLVRKYGTLFTKKLREKESKPK